MSKARELLRNMPAKAFKREKQGNVLTLSAEADPHILAALARVEAAVKAIPKTVIPEYPKPERIPDYSVPLRGLAQSIADLGGELRAFMKSQVHTDMSETNRLLAKLIEVMKTPREIEFDGEDPIRVRMGTMN